MEDGLGRTGRKRAAATGVCRISWDAAGTVGSESMVTHCPWLYIAYLGNWVILWGAGGTLLWPIAFLLAGSEMRGVEGRLCGQS